MAAELDRIDQANGKAAMFSVKETPWHRQGEVLTEAPTFAAAMELGGLNFPVALQPMKALVTVNEAGDTIEVDVPENRAVIRMDRKEVLGVVGPSYHVLQNVDAFNVLEPLIDTGLATIETGGALRGGRDVWMMVKFNLESSKVRAVMGDEVKPFGLISNNHNGARKVTIQETPIRVVCANTLGFALAGTKSRNGSMPRDRSIAIRHTSNVKENVVTAAADLFGQITNRYEAIADQYAALKATVLSEALFARLVLDVAAPLPLTPKSERKDNIAKAAFEKATLRAEKKRARLVELWTAGDGHTGDGSAWEAYNAATQSFDHDADLWGAKDQLESLFDGGLAKAKNEVVQTLVDFVMA